MTTAILLQTASSGMIQFVLLGGMFVVMYFFIIRPQQKKTKDQEAFRKSIKAGDKVVTIGGLHGVVGTVDADSTVTLIVDRTIKMKFDISAIAGPSTKIS
jgi:preprotein translocase subunit YajC